MGKSENSTKTSYLTPTWMQLNYPRNKQDTMVKAAPHNVTVRNERNRTFLLDKAQPKKSVWSFGDYRHNVTTKELADRFSHQAESKQVV